MLRREILASALVYVRSCAVRQASMDSRHIVLSATMYSVLSRTKSLQCKRNEWC